ncbi:MAG: aldo/keto reductase, partial [bacterium]
MKDGGKISRREFFRLVGAGLLVGLTGSSVRGKTPSLPTRPLGNTGFSSTIVGFGGGIIPNGPWETGVFAIQQAVNEGVNYFDTASQYGFGESERMYGSALRKHRDKIFLATKTLEREYLSSQREIEGSLKRLKVERVDLLQIHSVNDMSTLHRVLGRNGSLRACEEMKRRGGTRFIGITGHKDPAVLEKALEEYPFDSILVPVSAMDAYVRDFIPLCEKAQKKGVAVIGMKVFGAGRVLP